MDSGFYEAAYVKNFLYILQKMKTPVIFLTEKYSDFNSAVKPLTGSSVI